MTLQEEFEKWAETEGYSLERNSNRYVSPSTNATWIGWEASATRSEMLFEILMRRNIEITDEAYLSLRVVGVPPSEEQFVSRLRQVILVGVDGYDAPTWAP